MASTMATMAVLNTKCMNLNTPKTTTTQSKPISKPITLPKGLTITPIQTPTITGPAAIAAGAVFATLGSMDPALAAQQIAQIAEADNRGLALLLPIIPALGWVLFNILQPALNQINKMRGDRAVVVGLGLGGLGLAFSAQEASARELAEAAGSDSRGQLLLLVVLPAIGWVLFNILQPALNQINKMRSQ